MIYKNIYVTPKGFDNLLLINEDECLIGLYFINGQNEQTYQDLAIFKETKRWLDLYFEGKVPDFIPKYKLANLTLFQENVIKLLINIPYGKTWTYNDIAKLIAKEKGIKKMSCQAIGHALSKNPLCIIFPCHRVIGSSNNLIGYNGGINNKKALLVLEGVIL